MMKKMLLTDEEVELVLGGRQEQQTKDEDTRILGDSVFQNFANVFNSNQVISHECDKRRGILG